MTENKTSVSQESGGLHWVLGGRPQSGEWLDLEEDVLPSSPWAEWQECIPYGHQEQKAEALA